MISYTCDGCGVEIQAKALRYCVTIDVKAAYAEMEIGLADLVRDHRAELLNLIERLKNKDPKAIEESIFKRIELDLCPRCQRAYLRNPLRFHPEQGAVQDEIDIDAFLRSLDRDGEGGGEHAP